jgi:uncharacterized protein (TIGR03437 family)
VKDRVRCFAIFAAALAVIPAFAQVRGQADHRATANLDALARQRSSFEAPPAAPREVYEPERVIRRRKAAKVTTVPRQAEMPAASAASVAPSFGGFPALSDNFTAIPPDTGGAVGPQHVVTMLNTQVLIQSRAGAVRDKYPISLDSFWSPLGNFTDTFDPRILYDAASDRWIACAAVNAQKNTSALLLAVSQTGDPGGTWNYFRADVGASGNWGDYPELGFNENWVVVSLNLFRVTGNERYQGTNLYVFSKSDLYQNGKGSFATFSDGMGEFAPVLDFDNHPNTLYLMQAYAADAGVIPGTGVIRISKLQGTVGAETFLAGNGGEIAINNPWSDTGPNDADFGPQPGTSTRIDTGDSRLQNCVMRDGTIWCAHTIFLPYPTPTRASVQWFQINPASPPQVIQRGRIDDPSSANFYAYPSIAVNKKSDVLIGYTRFSANDYPSADFSFRTAADPPNAMQPDVVYKRGEASYVSVGTRTGMNRWGDFSVTWADPVNDLTFWTLQEYAATPPQGRTGAFGTWWAQVTAPSAGLSCIYLLSPASQLFDSSGGSGSVAISATSGCPWMAASNVPWITINSGTPGSGSGTVEYTVAKTAAASEQRTGAITIAGQTFTVTQKPAAGGADLAVTSMTAPATAQAGAPATLTAVVKNQSTIAAGAFRIGFYFGRGPSLSASDTLLGTCSVSGLAAGASTTCSQDAALPSGAAAGTYAIGAIADDQNQVADPNRANNIRLSDFGPIAITVPPPRPQFPAQGVVSAASYQGGSLAPGEVVVLFGVNLGPPALQRPEVSASGVVDTVAGGTRVLFDGTPAPMLYAISGQVSAVVPFAVQGHGNTQVQVEYQGTPSNPITIPVVASSPGIFTQDMSGRGPGAILNQDYSLNTAAGPGGAPAARGSSIMIYATGGGAMKPGAAEGTLAQPPYVEVSQPVSARIGGLPARVDYAGVAPGIIVGVLQINVVVPVGVSPGSAVPVEVTIGGVTSPAGATVAVR